MSRRKPYTLLAPAKGKRRHWTVQFRPTPRQRISRSTGSPHRATAQEWAVAWIKEHSPALARLLDLKPLKLPGSKASPVFSGTHLESPPPANPAL
jgi:hypothetical protein